MTGYADPEYARSLAEFGAPLQLTRSGGWVLRRQIPGFPYCDAMGCYPLFACQDWSQLHADLDNIGNELVSLSLVTDPFGEYDPSYLHRCFNDLVIPFKEHFIADLRRSVSASVSRHHRYYSRKALRSVYVETWEGPTQFIGEWVDLYANVIKRHDLRGIKAFSRTAFARQLGVPGMVMLRAVSQGTTVGAHLWYVQGEVAYSHLSASTALGYSVGASYALYWSAIEYFADKVRWLDLGAGAGVDSSGTEGLREFKRGWSTGARSSYFCGRIFDHAKYSEIVKASGIGATDYFPAYRSGEFA